MSTTVKQKKRAVISRNAQNQIGTAVSLIRKGKLKRHKRTLLICETYIKRFSSNALTRRKNLEFD